MARPVIASRQGYEPLVVVLARDRSATSSVISKTAEPSRLGAASRGFRTSGCEAGICLCWTRVEFLQDEFILETFVPV